MLESAYRKRLAADLPKWRDAGWLSQESANAILESVPQGRAAFGLSTVVGAIGGLLVGLGVIAFVSANWQEIPRLARFGLLAAGMAIAYGAAVALERRKLRVFAEVALLVAALVFGAAIVLVGQSYHLGGEFADAVLLWLVGVFIGAALTGSPTLAMVGMIGGGYWTWLAIFDLGISPHWAGIWTVIVGGAIATIAGSRNARIVAVLAFIYWGILAISSGGDRFDWSMAGGLSFAANCALALFGLGVLVSTFGSGRIAALGSDALWPALAATLVLTGIAQSAETASAHEHGVILMAVAATVVGVAFAGLAAWRRGLAWIDVGAIAAIGALTILFALNVPAAELPARLFGAVMVLVAALWAVNLGQRGYAGPAKTTGLVAIGLEIIYLYVRTLGTLMDTALAFLLGGVLFMALAWALYRLDRYLAARASPVAAAGATR